MTSTLERFFDVKNKYELSIDEVGRGCLFGRTYVACVVLPHHDNFDGTNIKDSKKFSSKKKIKQVSDYIKQNALFWHVEYVENDVIDKINILQAVMQGMHNCIHATITKIREKDGIRDPIGDEYEQEFMAVIDGNYFKPYIWYDQRTENIRQIPHVTVEQGDAKYMGIAAASILAKVARDEYIAELCEKYPVLSQNYSLEKNMGYGTKAHLDGIRQHGITKWHRKSFGICKTTDVSVNLTESGEPMCPRSPPPIL
jgi:ribonuclease HII